MADKKQSSLLAWLKDAPSPKTARVGKVRDNEADIEECRDVEEADYFTSDEETTESLQDTDCNTETTPLNCTAQEDLTTVYYFTFIKS